MKTLLLLLTLSLPLHASINYDPRFADFQFPELNATCAELLDHTHVSDLVYLSMVAALQFSELPPIEAVFAAMLENFSKFSYPAMDFGFFELLFRKRNLPIHLVAAPGQPGQRFASPKDRSPRTYWIIAHIEREQLAQDQKAEWGVSDEENIRRLDQAGFLLPN